MGVFPRATRTGGAARTPACKHRRHCRGGAATRCRGGRSAVAVHHAAGPWRVRRRRQRWLPQVGRTAGSQRGVRDGTYAGSASALRDQRDARAQRGVQRASIPATAGAALLQGATAADLLWPRSTQRARGGCEGGGSDGFLESEEPLATGAACAMARTPVAHPRRGKHLTCARIGLIAFKRGGGQGGRRNGSARRRLNRKSRLQPAQRA